MASSASLKSLEGDWQYTSEKVINIKQSQPPNCYQIKVQYINAI